ncbi:MAG: carbamoyltransferase HypF [Candidatus Latescibacterota bacterium]
MPPPLTAAGPPRQRLRVLVGGAVQGVGFRPFVYRLARELGLCGWVGNTPRGVTVEAEGDAGALRHFLTRLESERPPHASIQSLEPAILDPVGYDGFAIRPSEEGGEKRVLVMPDIATCAECLREVWDPSNRRYRYPFTNCTHCGPRYSIIEALPYDRPNTTMKGFALCAACRAEYEDPGDRRFHAQPIACPACGPRLWLWDRAGAATAEGDAALRQAAAAIAAGAVVAVKGLGGFHLMVDARSAAAVGRLRQAKDREEKPFALMYPSLAAVRRHCAVDALEARLLAAPEAPIVLLSRLPASHAELAASVAPHNPCLGVMVPYTPLHHLLLAEVGRPVVATSGNLADEPICTDESEALRRLGQIADLFLVHDRPIRRHVDDSIARLVGGREQVLRRARGYAPLPVPLRPLGPPVLAVGGHLKAAVAVVTGDQAFLSQHIGDLETPQAQEAFHRVIADLQHLYAVEPAVLACDAHPDYVSTRAAVELAGQRGVECLAVQHHHAHVLSCMAENEVEGTVLGVAWDGTGHGPDGTVWGGEFLRVSPGACERLAHLRSFRLPGGEQAVREPRRAGVGVLYEAFGARALEREDLAPVAAFTAAERALLLGMLERGVSSPLTSSAGRLFDAVASLAGLRQRNAYEGQAAMALEYCAAAGVEDGYDLLLQPTGPGRWVLDWEPMVHQVLADLAAQAGVARVSARFHNGLVEAVVAVARSAGEERVVLTGGCLQNRYLCERLVRRLRAAGFRAYWHQRVPPNDGGVALGQALAARTRRRPPPN